MMLTSDVGKRRTSCVSGTCRSSLDGPRSVRLQVSKMDGGVRCVDQSGWEDGSNCAAEELSSRRHGDRRARNTGNPAAFMYSNLPTSQRTSSTKKKSQKLEEDRGRVGSEPNTVTWVGPVER
jgi:hypothetical protein